GPQGRRSDAALSARHARHRVPCGFIPGNDAAYAPRDHDGRRGAERRRRVRGSRMSNEAIGYLGMLALTLLILLRVPVAVALGLVGFFGYCALEGWNKAGLALGGVPMELASAYGLSVVPLFMLMGALATTAGLSRDLFYGANVVFRQTRGALAMAAIAASAAFGAVCGSSVATAATLGRVSIPEMLKAGYSHQLAAGAVAAGGTLGILIPPSLILMIYAIIAQQSVSKLFAAALVPG